MPRFLIALISFTFLLPASASADEALWRALAGGGYVLMIRHALAPGTGDPADFRLGDCRTQRNLSEEGRAEARRLGVEFRQRGIPVGTVLSSEWCRCRDTAALAFGDNEAWTALNSFFGDASSGPARTRAVLDRARRIVPGSNMVLVTHQVNITAVSGVHPSPSEIVVLKPAAGKLVVVGRLRPAAAPAAGS